MSGGLMLFFVGAFLLLIGFLETAPRPKRRWYDDTSGDRPAGFLMMLLGGLLVAFGVVALGVDALLALGLAGVDDPPLGVFLMFIGAGAGWLWLYDRQRLRRPEPTSRWARLIGALGKAGKRVGPAILVAGVILTMAL